MQMLTLRLSGIQKKSLLVAAMQRNRHRRRDRVALVRASLEDLQREKRKTEACFFFSFLLRDEGNWGRDGESSRKNER